MNRKTFLLTLLALVGVMWTTDAQAQKLRVFDKEYTADTSVDIGGGTITWDKASATLTLDEVEAYNMYSTFISCENFPLLKIVLVGENSVETEWQILYIKNCNVEISGGGSFKGRSSEVAEAIQQNLSTPHTLTIKNCKFDVQGKERSIIGFSKGAGAEMLNLVIDNAKVKVKGSATRKGEKRAGISRLKSCELKNCHINTSGVKFGKKPDLTYYELIDEENNSYPGEVTIVPGD